MNKASTSRLATFPWLRWSFAMFAGVYGLAAARADTDTATLPKDLTGPQMSWGAEASNLRAGLAWGQFSGRMNIVVLALTFQTNVGWTYVAPPGKKFLKIELRDAQGALLSPLKGKELAGELPQQMRTEDLPHSRPSGHHASMIENWLLIGDGLPGRLREFFLDDAYHIKREGDYTLSVWVAVYKFAPNRQTVSRMDLPPVSVKLHLVPSAPESK